MPHTKRELLQRLAETVGGPEAERLRAVLARPSPIDDLLDRPMSDEAWTAEWTRLERDLPKALATIRSRAGEKPGTWGGVN